MRKKRQTTEERNLRTRGIDLLSTPGILRAMNREDALVARAVARGIPEIAQAVDAIASFPNRFPLAPEARGAKRKLRHLLYGKKPHVYRVIEM